MTQRRGPNVAASVRQRLLTLAKRVGAEYNQILIRYAIERLLFRLSASSHRTAFVLKGAMLFTVWEGDLHRPTQDVDFLGFGDHSLERLTAVFRELCTTSVEDDGLVFDPDSIRAEAIRAIDEYGGVRIALDAKLGTAVIRVQVDVGLGDAVTPGPTDAAYPTLLEFSAPVIRVYPRETVVAEKVQAIVKFGLINTRYKDYYDLDYLAHTFDFDGPTLSAALTATFDRRNTPLPADVPIGLTDSFASDLHKNSQWAAFGRRLGIEPRLSALPEVIHRVSCLVMPPLRAAVDSQMFRKHWKPDQGWLDAG